MKNPLDKLKKKKVDDSDSEVNNENSNNTSDNKTNERRKAFTEKPLPLNEFENDADDIKFKHLIETELNVIQKKAKALYLNTEEGFDEKSGANYWKVSVNEFLSYVNQRSKIIIEQMTGESHSVNIELDDGLNNED